VIPRLDIGTNGTIVVPQRYPRPGRPNAVVELYVGKTDGASRVKIDLGADPDIYVARVVWSKDGKSLYVERQTRDQKRLDLLEADPSTGKTRVLLSETSRYWIELNNDFRPLKDGSFIWGSERSGFEHLYLYDHEGKLLRPLTSGDWGVDEVAAVDEDAGRVLFAASKDTPLERQLYAVSLSAPGEPQQLTAGHGWWTISASDNGKVFAGIYSDPTTPPRTGFYSADGKLVRWIAPNALDATHPFYKYLDHFRTPTYGTIKAADGTELEYAISTPPGFDPSKKYPVIVSVYGGPHLQTVRKEWGKLTDQLLLEEGYILFRLDNRGSFNRSVAFKTANYHRLGTVETEDQLAGVAFLKSLPYVDSSKIGVMGWSYGGFMTLTLLTAPNSPFAAGAAGAPPVDWTLYDTHYTEQFMGTPKENPTGYRASEVVPNLERMTGALLLMQGMADDNVSFENSTRVMTAMQESGRPFDLMLFPGERHGPHGNPRQLVMWRKYLDFFRRKLKGEL
jgi:dipeptidyl-peptidase-4